MNENVDELFDHCKLFWKKCGQKLLTLSITWTLPWRLLPKRQPLGALGLLPRPD